MFPRAETLVGQAQAGSSLVALLPLVLVLIIFYLLLILPAQRRQKKIAAMHRSLKTGDKIVTNGGLYGVVAGVEDETIQLRVADQVKVRVARNAVAGLQSEGSKEN
ncbi:MAG TPA: preprotein translocase subunit YajC [Patescibacteria group bacterium]|nr:preprotein translocase subunit YajC [Patescibacteria group bacterium]